MIFYVGDEVDADDGVRKLEGAIITEVGIHDCYWVGEDIFTSKELTLIRRAWSSAKKSAVEIIKNMTEQPK